MIKWLATVATALLSYSVCLAADPANLSPSGTHAEGNLCSISGNNFGSNSLNYEWTGDNIEAGNATSYGGGFGDMFSKSGWSVSTSSINEPPRYSTNYAHSGSQSIGSHITAGAQYDAAYRYLSGTVTSMYVTWWAYMIDNENVGGQWKLWKFMCSSSTFSDNDTCLWGSQWYSQTGGQYGNSYVLMNASACENSWDNSPSDPDPNGWFGKFIDQEEWTRLELYFETGSSKEVTLVSYRNGSPTVIFTSEAYGVNPAASNFLFQNYWGNHIESTSTHDSEFYADDHFIQLNSRARVEVCEGSTWAARGLCEIQLPTSWSDTSISYSFNEGALASGTQYLYVVNSGGEVNATGEPITVGGTGGVQPEITLSACQSDGALSPATVTGTATDSDGTISDVSWSNITTSASDSCTADDGAFDEASEAFTCYPTQGFGDNHIVYTATDNDSDADTQDCESARYVDIHQGSGGSYSR